MEYDESDQCCQNFTLVDGWPREKNLQIEGASTRLARAADIVRVAVDQLSADPLIFLHRHGCDECAVALASATLSV